MSAPLSPRFLQLHDEAARGLADEATAGLLQPDAAVSPKFLYDPLGSRLFDAITRLQAYYPTRTEAAVMAAHGADIAAAALQATGAAPALIDVGAGDGVKAARLFGALAPRQYVALDISTEFLGNSLERLQREHPALPMVGVGLDFSASLALPDGLVEGPALVFYPGSSIGNFAPDEARRLLREARALAAGGALLIGADLVKPTAILEAAYDDELGVTAAFNLNLLLNLNRLLGADFDVRQWRHVARYDVDAGRIEMHLAARVPTVVRWPGGERRFEPGERIHTESSYKWTPEAFVQLLRDAGFRRTRTWTDTDGWFGVFLASE